MKKNILQRLFAPVDARPLEVFRMLFGVILLLQVYSYLKSDFIARGILAPRFLFTFDWFPFVHPLPEGGMKAVLALTIATPVFIALNRFFKVAVAVYLLAFSYLFLLEESYYNNHFYFIILLTCYFLFYSPVVKNGKKVIPYWLLLLFRVQVVVVYFYGGLAKLNPDWLGALQPVRILLQMNAAQSPFPALTTSEFAAYYLGYGGVAFDLGIGFFLLWRRTFKAAALATVLFHLTNFWIFNFGEGGGIGIFPLLMIGANVLFADPKDLERLAGKFRAGIPAGRKKRTAPDGAHPAPSRVLPLLVVLVITQLLLPFRHLLVPGHTDWTGQQQWFSWRMKIASKQSTVRFTIRRFEGDTPVPVEINRLLNTMQINMMAQHADMIYKFVQYIKKDLHDRLGMDRAIIHAEIKVAFNGRPAQYFVDPQKNLFDIKYHPYGKNDWVVPLKTTDGGGNTAGNDR